MNLNESLDVGDIWLLNTGKQVTLTRRRFDLIYNNKIEENLLEEALKYDYCSFQNIEKDLFIKFLYLSPYDIKLNKSFSNLNNNEVINGNAAQLNINRLVSQISLVASTNEHKRQYLPLLHLSRCASQSNFEVNQNSSNRLQAKIAKKFNEFQKLSSFEECYMQVINNYKR
jgi:hypothetical protein